MKNYTVCYKLFFPTDKEEFVTVLANNKVEAYDKAVYDVIPKKEGIQAYSAWVSGVTYNNGNYRSFNTFEGKPY